MKRAEKKQVVKAARVLARGYANNSLGHRFDTCPLCVLFHDDHTTMAKSCSLNCPNMAFIDDTSHYGCMSRQNRFENLNWNGVEYRESETLANNLTNLSKFWTRVGNYLSDQKAEVVENLGESERIKTHIVKIATELNKE